MGSSQSGSVLGKTVFALTAIAMVGFFWWLLIYDHGAVGAHENAASPAVKGDGK